MARMREKFLVRRREGNRRFERTSSRWEDNGKINLKEIKYEHVEWLSLAQDRQKNVVMTRRMP